MASTTTGSAGNYDTRALTGQQIDQRTPAGTYNYLYDPQGNVVGLTDSNAHLVNQYAYDPYGNKTTNTGTTANPFSFQSGYTTSTGLIHYGARYLNPTDARWTQPDPLNQFGDLTQSDQYGFAGDNTINLKIRAGRGAPRP